jgi:hypothetical protein
MPLSPPPVEANQTRREPERSEPIAWYYERDTDKAISFAPDRDCSKYWQPLYTAVPPHREPLSDEQIDEIYCKASEEFDAGLITLEQFVRSIQAAHGITGGKE